MNRRFYHLTRDLHLYLGLFISPFILVFSISVFFVVHTWLPKLSPETSTTRVETDVPLPPGITNLSGRPLIDAVKPVLAKANVPGEIGYVRHFTAAGKLIIPVIIPGRETIVTINITNREASIVTREIGLADALVTLHKFPGPHVADLRVNWFFMRAWRWMADATVYLTLFLTISGIYLWFILRAERAIGYALLFAGAVVFFGLVYALSY
jgi:hypothetical protein